MSASTATRNPWNDWINALKFAEVSFTKWSQEGGVQQDEYRALVANYQVRVNSAMQSAAKEEPFPENPDLPSVDHCWSCSEPTDTAEEGYCAKCGATLEHPSVAKYRYLVNLIPAIKKHEEAGRLRLATSHALLAEVRARLKAVRGLLERNRLLTAKAVTADSARSRARKPSPPRRSLFEIVLDPQNIQWLLTLGGGLFVVGLVVWLASLGIFKNPAFVAGCLGVANAAVLAGGWAVLIKTRYRTAGRALTLLACLVMPLNLWFYHSHDLITLEGHLWVAALFMSILYAASARVLRDSLFVYVFMGGITLTGLLLLADMGKFWEIAPPSTLLVILGLIGIHVERAFAEADDGPFSRRRFGLAFFWSGHIILAGGLLLLLGAQIAGDWLYKPIFQPIYEAHHASQPLVVTEMWARLLALCLILSGLYAYLYSDLVVRRIGAYLYVAALLVLWAEIQVLNVLGLTVGQEFVLGTLALTALAANLLYTYLEGDPRKNLVRSFPAVGLALSLVPVVYGVLLHSRSISSLHQAWHYEMNWGYVAAMLATVVSCRISAFLFRRSQPKLAAVYFFATGAATLVGAAGLLTVLGLKTWDAQAPWLMVIPILYMVAARLYRGHASEIPVVWVGHIATAVMLLSSLGASVQGFGLLQAVQGETLNLTLALFFAEAALFYGLAATFRERGINVYLGTAMACAAVWQVLSFEAVSAEYYTLTFAALGLILLIAYRFAMLENVVPTRLVLPAFQSANALLSLSFVAAALLYFSRLIVGAFHDHVDWVLLSLLLALVAIALAAAVLVREPAWRRWYVTMAIVQGVLAFLVAHTLFHLSPMRRLELFCVAVGLLLLIAGHVGWYREQNQERQGDMVSFGLFLGSVLIGLPLAVAVLVQRGHNVFSTGDEIAMLVVGLVFLASGFMFQIKSTTLTGGGLTILYLLGLLLFIHWDEVQTAALVLTIGGGSVFGLGLLLSVYRDRLLALPEKVRRRQGIFQVLTWR